MLGEHESRWEAGRRSCGGCGSEGSTFVEEGRDRKDDEYKGDEGDEEDEGGGTRFHGFLHLVDKRISPFKPRHSEDQGLNPDRRNKESILPGNPSNRIRQNNI